MLQLLRRPDPEDAASRPILELRDVWKTWWVRGHPIPVARGITLDIPRGTGVGLMGRNGAGKSTFLSMIAGTLNPDRAAASSATAASLRPVELPRQLPRRS